uniref:Leukotriene C4 synthase n=1 Tax=Chrysemys picta bellii TaxID=8478 RepID=A0A8C3FRH8_CHRPI
MGASHWALLYREVVSGKAEAWSHWKASERHRMLTLFFLFSSRVNCSEYFPIFLAILWQAGLFFHQGLTAALGLLYLYSRYCYFMGYKESSSGRLAPMYFSAGVLWILIGLAAVGILHFLLSHHLGMNVLLFISL